MQKIELTVNELAEVLIKRKWVMATAESCTGGWISKCCTDLAGSSAWFDRGFVTYCNQAKQEMLNVETRALVDYGAVSEVVAKQMAAGALNAAKTDVALAVTGVAGPSGGSEEKPVGLVWFAWAVRGQTTQSESMIFQGDRNSVRMQTVSHSLFGLLLRISA
jgi:nicotinamide-nucleotide amidase